MSLEAKIELLTSAVVELTRVMQTSHQSSGSAYGTAIGAGSVNYDAALQNKPQDKGPVPPANEDEAKAQRDAEKAGNDSPKPSTTTDTSPPSSNESRTVTYDDVKNVTIAVSKIDKAKAVAGLARFGVTTAKALNESQWLDYVIYMEKVVAGDVDPEASHE